jgi:FkbM family methyltransferase
VHVFQIAFAFALEELGESVDHLPLAYNLPTHSPAIADCVLDDDVRALHFHRAFDPASGLLHVTGHARVDAAIARVNDVIRRRRGDPWWLKTPSEAVAGPAPELATVVRSGVHGRFATRPCDHVTRQLEEFGAHTRNEIAMLVAFLRPGDQIIDVGAHIGTFTVPFARTVSAEGRVVAVEPSPSPFELLERNLALNDVAERTIARRALVTEHDGRYRPVEVVDHTSATHWVPADAGADDGTAPACIRHWTRSRTASIPRVRSGW